MRASWASAALRARSCKSRPAGVSVSACERPSTASTILPALPRNGAGKLAKAQLRVLLTGAKKAVQAEGAAGLRNRYPAVTVSAFAHKSGRSRVPDTEPSPHETRQAQGGTRLLFVDDDTLVRELLGEALQHQGYDVAQAEDGNAALAWLATGQPVDLMITDFAMPEMNGLELIAEVLATRPDLPIILLTGYADAQVGQNLATLTAGTGVLLQKPIRVKDLTARIAARLAT